MEGFPQIDFEWYEANKDSLDPDTRRQVDQILAELEAIYERNPLERFVPHGKQVEFFSSRDRVRAFLGGNRSGKTTAGIVDDLIQAVDGDSLPARLRQFKRFEPPFKCRIVAPDFTENVEKVIFEKLREWAPRDQLKGGSFDKAYSKQLRRLDFANGSWFSFMTFEQDLDKFGGTALHRVHYDEEPPEEIRKECRMRLTDYGGDEIFTMTPLKGMSWMYDGVFAKRHEPNYCVVQVDMEDNPHLDPAEIAIALEGLSQDEINRRKKGLFVAFGGSVLPEFGSDHLIDQPSPSQIRGLDVVVGIDPGLSRGGVVWIAFDRDDRAFVFDELYPENKTPDQIVPEILSKNRMWGLDEPQYVIDPSARNRDLRTGMRLEEEYHRLGIFPSHGINDQEVGVTQMKRRLQADPPMLFVSKTCTHWLWERERWRLKPTNDGSFSLMPGNDHLMDPTRYVLMERFYGPEFDDVPNRHRRWNESYRPGVQERPVPVTGALT